MFTSEHITTERSPLQLWSSAPDLGTIRVDKPHVRLELPLDVEVIGPGHRLEPIFTAIATDGTLTVHLAGENEPAIDVDEINMTFRVEKTEEGRVLTLDPLVVFDRRKLSPKLVKSLLYLFDPTIGDTPQMSGEFSLSLDKLRIPLGIPRDQAVRASRWKANSYSINVSTEVKNPMRQALVQLVADMNGKHASDVVRLAQDAEIRFQVRDGRLHHEGLRIGFPDIDPALQISSRGSVGLDKSLDLHVELPRLDQAQRKEKGPAKCHITGTIDKPRIAVEDASLVLRQPGRKEPIIAVDDINLNMQVEKTASGPVLAVEPVEVFKKAKLSVVTANGLVSLIAPDVQAERQVTGEISLSLSTIRIPLGVPRDELAKGLEAEGKLTLHHVTTEVKKPMWQALIKLLADMNGKQPSNVVRLVDDAEIQFQLRDGRLHHDGLRVGFPEIDPDLVVSSRGSIGADETLDLHLEFPRLRKDKRDKGPVKCHITGTLSEPKISVPDASLVVQLTDTDKATLTVDNVNLTFGVETSKDGRMLTLAPVTLFEKRKVTPEVGDQLLNLIAPTLSELSGVQGEISLSFETFRVPLGVPKSEAVKRVELAGKLHLHQITVSTKTPLVRDHGQAAGRHVRQETVRRGANCRERGSPLPGARRPHASRGLAHRFSGHFPGPDRELARFRRLRWFARHRAGSAAARPEEEGSSRSQGAAARPISNHGNHRQAHRDRDQGRERQVTSRSGHDCPMQIVQAGLADPVRGVHFGPPAGAGAGARAACATGGNQGGRPDLQAADRRRGGPQGGRCGHSVSREGPGLLGSRCD